MTPEQFDDRYRPLARRLQENHMQRLGIAPTMELALACNRVRYGAQEAWRQSLYRDEFADLLEENGGLGRPPLVMRDGWAIDRSRSLPHLDRLLEDAEQIIAERHGQRITPAGAYRSFFQDVWTAEDADRYPSFVDFATSSDLLAVVGDYLGTVPAISTTLPSGIRLVESNAAFDDEPNQPKDSQLYHIDYYSLPNVYVLVLLRDTTIENGPWTFVPRARSQDARRQLGYWEQGRPYRVSDEELYSVVDRAEVIEFSYPRGTVLFIESSACFHYGSRNAVSPRWQLMYGYTGACRTDFSEYYLTRREYPHRDSDSRLRTLVLNKYLLPPGRNDGIAEEPLQVVTETLRRVGEQLDAAAGRSGS